MIGLEAWKIWGSYPKQFQEQLIEAFCEGARFQLDQMEHDPGWKYVENFNREYARCKRHLTYTNTVSPIVHEEVLKRVPELKGKLHRQRSSRAVCSASPRGAYRRPRPGP